MARLILAIMAFLACGVFTSTAIGAPKGWFVGGGFTSQSVSGDLDGERVLVNKDLDRAGSVGKVGSGTGLAFDGGYMVGKNFGFEYFSPSTLHKATHKLEKSESDANVAAGLLGVRLATGGDTLDLFARLGLAAGTVSYDTFGHRGSFSPSFSPTSDGKFSLTGGGAGIGIGMEWYLTQHLGLGLGYTVFDLKLDTANIDGQQGTLDKSLKAQFHATDVTILYHF